MVAKDYLQQFEFFKVAIAQRLIFKDELMDFIKKGYGTRRKMLSMIKETDDIISWMEKQQNIIISHIDSMDTKAQKDFLRLRYIEGKTLKQISDILLRPLKIAMVVHAIPATSIPVEKICRVL